MSKRVKPIEANSDLNSPNHGVFSLTVFLKIIKLDKEAWFVALSTTFASM